MSMEKAQFHNALNRLETMAKGGATQLHHTSSDSNPGSWPGGAQSDQNEHEDGIDDNGTDYNGVRKSLALKIENSEALTPAEVAISKGLVEDAGGFIQHKINSKETLTPVENWFFRGGWNEVAEIAKGVEGANKNSSPKPSPAGAPGEDDDAASVGSTHGGEKESSVEGDAKKSFAEEVANSETLQQGFELSPFLYEFTRAHAEGLDGIEARISKNIYDMIAPLYEHIEYLETELGKSIKDQGEFNKAFGETIVGIGQHVAGNADVQQQQAQMPAGPPKSQLRAIPGGLQEQQSIPQGIQPVAKSFDLGGLDVGENALNKTQIVNAMVELVKAGKLNALDVSKFEMTGEIAPQVENMVKSFAGQAS